MSAICTTGSVVSLSVSMAIIPGEPGLVGYIGARDDGGGGVTTGAIRRAELQLNRHHQQSNGQIVTA